MHMMDKLGEKVTAEAGFHERLLVRIILEYIELRGR